MKNFLIVFVGCVASIVAAVIVAGIGAAIFAETQEERVEDASYLVLRLSGELLEYSPPGDPMSTIIAEDTETLQRILSNLEKAAIDDRIAGVIVHLSADSNVGFAATEEIRNALKRVRAAEKTVVGWADSFDAQDYWLLAACESVAAPPRAYLSFTGFTSQSMHVKEALQALGIEPNLHKIRDYKSAAEMVTRSEMSDEARENRAWILDERWQQFTKDLEEDRKLDEPAISALMKHALLTSAEALERGLLDRIVYWGDLEAQLQGDGYEADERLRTVSSQRYAEVDPDDLDLTGEKKIAIIHAQGLISGQKNGTNPLFGITMGHKSISAELRRAALDDDVAAIVFRVDSRGGDSLTSDLIGHEVEVTAEKKPVVVSMVNVAASGGYAISYRATKVIANAGTITGSIGSISGKLNVQGLIDKLGISHDRVTKGPNALLLSDLRGFSEEERARFQEHHWAGFNPWLRDVANRRNMTFEQAEQLAYGRVWSGRQAAKNGLIDEVGDLNRAIEIAKELGDVAPEDSVTLEHLPEAKGLLESVLGSDDTLATAIQWATYRAIRDQVVSVRKAVVADVSAYR